ncbi:unnamed protein product [Prorocentrum cordatum]|uniref:Uncharacterized protein n=1 Tax=Prorocentrum cordatum TaxID=2364126 RepID=A0ABN9RQJ2_9DINO|nr:unnamed protein product [Polarella glacialis]
MRLRPPPPRRGRVREVRVVNASPARLTRHPLHLRAVQRRPSARANGAPQAGAGAARGGATAAGGSDAVDHRLVLSWLPVVSALGGHARQKAGCQWWQRWEGAGLPRDRAGASAAAARESAPAHRRGGRAVAGGPGREGTAPAAARAGAGHARLGHAPSATAPARLAGVGGRATQRTHAPSYAQEHGPSIRETGRARRTFGQLGVHMRGGGGEEGGGGRPPGGSAASGPHGRGPERPRGGRGGLRPAAGRAGGSALAEGPAAPRARGGGARRALGPRAGGC